MPPDRVLGQTATQETKPLPQVSVTTHKTAKRAQPGKPARGRGGPPSPPLAPTTQTAAPQPLLPSAADAAPGMNLGAVAGSATRLGLSVLETPASVDVVNQQTMQTQGYRTNIETAQGAVGVQAIDVGGAQGGFAMRGFVGDQINVLYNGINLGPQDLTGRVVNSFVFDQVEFLKGASALESGLGAIGGSVNYVSRQPTSGPIQNEAFVSINSLGTFRSGYGSGGTLIKGLDYRFDVTFDHVNSFIDDDSKNLSSLHTQFNYQATPDLKTWVAFEYYKDEGNTYWGTPLVPIAFSGPFATTGIVSGSEFSHFNGSFLGPVTINSRTLTTNYNTLDNHTGATQYWGRGGFEYSIANNVTLKDQAYVYAAKRSWFELRVLRFRHQPRSGDRQSPQCGRSASFLRLP